MSTGAAFQPFSSIDLLHRAERLRRAGTGWRRRCVLWPGRPWTTSPSPWTAGTACGCTLAAHRLGRVAHRRPTTGGTPPEPPAALRAAQLFEISQKPENRQGLGGGGGGGGGAGGPPPPPRPPPPPPPPPTHRLTNASSRRRENLDPNFYDAFLVKYKNHFHKAIVEVK